MKTYAATFPPEIEKDAVPASTSRAVSVTPPFGTFTTSSVPSNLTSVVPAGHEGLPATRVGVTAGPTTSWLAAAGMVMAARRPSPASRPRIVRGPVGALSPLTIVSLLIDSACTGQPLNECLRARDERATGKNASTGSRVYGDALVLGYPSNDVSRCGEVRSGSVLRH